MPSHGNADELYSALLFQNYEKVHNLLLIANKLIINRAKHYKVCMPTSKPVLLFKDKIA